MRRSSYLDSAATEAELDQWGAVVADEADRAEILRCVTCRDDRCDRITVRQGGICTPCHAAATPKRRSRR